MTFAEESIAHRDAVFSHLEQRVSIRTLLAHAFFPAVLGTTVPGPPVFVVALAVEYTFAGDGDVLLFEGIDEWREVEELDSFPAREDDRQVVFRVLAELDRCAFRDFEIHIALQANRAGQIRAGRNDDFAAAGF